MSVRIDVSWHTQLTEEFDKPYFSELTKFVKKAYTNDTIYPSPKHIFRALDLCPFEKVKVVILGQDPYHGVAQANGLSFSVNEGTVLPPSLKNIFKEIESDIGTQSNNSGSLTSTLKRDGDLSDWAKQGVLLLNATLTVKAHVAASHQGHGWEEFTNAVVQTLSDKREHLVFMLWGNYAKQKGTYIDRTKHLVLEASHPSPFSAYNGFFGCKHFSKANEYLIKHKKSPINWL